MPKRQNPKYRHIGIELIGFIELLPRRKGDKNFKQRVMERERKREIDFGRP